jgi:hypothetical protein
MALLRDYPAAIGEIIIKYSGTLERSAGDRTRIEMRLSQVYGGAPCERVSGRPVRRV